MTTYRTVKTSYQQKEPLGQRIGGAMSAFGGMLNNLSKNAQQWDELKKKDELEKKLKEQDKEFGDLVGGIYQGNALGDPGNVMSATDAKLPKPALPPTPPEEEAMFSIGGMSSPETSALQTSTPEQTPLTQPIAQQPESVLPNVPNALGGGQQEPQGADSAFKQMHEQRQMSKGIEKLRETVPDEDLKKIMAHTMKTAAIYRQYGNHEMAAKYQLGVLEMLQKQYGSDTSTLKAILANQLGKYRTDVGAKSAADRLAVLRQRVRQLGQKDATDRELTHFTSRINAAESHLTRADADVMSSPELKASLEQELQDLETQANDLLAERRGRRGSGPSSGSRPPKISGGPKPGDVNKGYRFKGGDPASPTSWEKM
jgi:hypothetical protein